MTTDLAITSDPEMLAKMPVKEVRAEIDRLLNAKLSDTELRSRLERLAQAPAFRELTWYWGPLLYARNRVIFRPFVLQHYATISSTGVFRWPFIRWQDHAGVLERWFAEVDHAKDIELFKKLYVWKHQEENGRVSDKHWRADVLERFRRASARHERDSVLVKLDLWQLLDEDTALELYRIDAPASRTFILKHSHERWGDRQGLWTRLFAAAEQQGDADFAFSLYRQQVDQKQWEKDALRLASEVRDPQLLNDELGRRHPEGWGLKLGPTFHKLVASRGRDVLPYVTKHLQGVFRSWWWGGRDGFDDLVRLAEERSWWDLWGALVRTCAKPDEFNKEVNRLLKKEANSEAAERLILLTGVSREWNFGPFSLAQVQQLDDNTAESLYELFPDLARGPFKMHISAGWFAAYPKLTERVLAAGDEIMIDYLASRLVTRPNYSGRFGSKQVDAAETLSHHYEALQSDAAEFSRRAVQTLTQVPAYAVWNYNRLISTNRLARLFLERSARLYLSYPEGIRDLLESPEIHAQMLGYRVRSLDDPAARELARANADLLQATLLRPLHRKTRALAFGALANAANDPAAASMILKRCREALDLPDKRYPKEELIGLVGRLLHRWPALRSKRERPLIYGAAI